MVPETTALDETYHYYDCCWRGRLLRTPLAMELGKIDGWTVPRYHKSLYYCFVARVSWEIWIVPSR